MVRAADLGILHPNRRGFVPDQPSDQDQCIPERRADKAHTWVIREDDIAHGDRLCRRCASPESGP